MYEVKNQIIQKQNNSWKLGSCFSFTRTLRPTIVYKLLFVIISDKIPKNRILHLQPILIIFVTLPVYNLYWLQKINCDKFCRKLFKPSKNLNIYLPNPWPQNTDYSIVHRKKQFVLIFPFTYFTVSVAQSGGCRRF